MIRTGEDYRESLRDGREVWVSGERVDDVTTHPAFKPLVDARARIYDMAHEDATRDVVSYAGDDGERNAISTQLPRTREDWHAKQRMVDAVFDDLGGVVTRVGDETVGEMWSLFDGKAVLDVVDRQGPATSSGTSCARSATIRSTSRPTPIRRAIAPSGRRIRTRHAAARRARERQRHRRARRKYETAAAYSNQAFAKPTIANWGDSELSEYAVGSSSRWAPRASSTSAAPASRAVPRLPTIPSRTASTRSTRC